MKSAIVTIGNQRLRAEVADTFRAKEIGLSLHSSLGVDEGMWFPYSFPMLATFHMSTVPFPIDMIFCRATADEGVYEVAQIVANIRPGDKGHYSCHDVSGVLETQGGFCRQHGIGLRSHIAVGVAQEDGAPIRVDAGGAELDDFEPSLGGAPRRKHRQRLSTYEINMPNMEDRDNARTIPGPGQTPAQGNPRPLKPADDSRHRRRRKERATTIGPPDSGGTKRGPSLNDVDKAHGRPANEMYDLHFESGVDLRAARQRRVGLQPYTEPTPEEMQFRVDLAPEELWDFDVDAMQGQLAIVGEWYEGIASLLNKIATDDYDFRDQRLEHVAAQAKAMGEACDALAEMAEQSMSGYGTMDNVS